MKLSVRGVLFIITLIVGAHFGFLVMASFVPFVLVSKVLDKLAGVQGVQAFSSAKDQRAAPKPTAASLFFAKIYHIGVDSTIGAWQAMVGFLLQYWFGMSVKATGVLPTFDNLPESSPLRQISPKHFFLAPPTPRDGGSVSVICMNHPTRLDWLVLWAFLARTSGVLRGLKIVLKQSLHRAPIFGWVLQFGRYLFFARHAVDDQKTVTGAACYVSRYNQQVTILIFPEGSDLSPSNVEKSQAFAEKNNLPKYTRVLNPRSKGALMIKEAFGVDHIDEWIDMTIAYEERTPGRRPTEKDMFSAELPKALHIWFKRYEFVKTKERTHFLLGSSDEAMEAWITNSFARKEQMLRAFYGDNRPTTLSVKSTAVGFHRGQLQEEKGETWIPLYVFGPLGWQVGTFLAACVVLLGSYFSIFALVAGVGNVRIITFSLYVVGFAVTKLGGFDQRVLYR